MARTIQMIFDEMKTEAISLATDANSDAMIAMFNNTSKVAIWRLLFYTVAFSIFVVESIFDLFKLEVDDTIKTLKPHSSRWYAEKSKAFQYGLPLMSESDQYDNTGLTQAQIDAMRIISHAAVLEQERGIRIKVAKTVGDDLGPLAAGELTAFTDYMEEVKDAGIKLLITSGNPDDLKASIRIFYDPLVLAGDGSRIDGTDSTPVQSALKIFLKNLPFNGLFVPQMAVDALQKVEGVVIVKDDQWLARYGALDFTGIDVEYIPDAGYLRINNINLSITFTPHASI
jgi:hypothetical protein